MTVHTSVVGWLTWDPPASADIPGLGAVPRRSISLDTGPGRGVGSSARGPWRQCHRHGVPHTPAEADEHLFTLAEHRDKSFVLDLDPGPATRPGGPGVVHR